MHYDFVPLLTSFPCNAWEEVEEELVLLILPTMNPKRKMDILRILCHIEKHPAVYAESRQMNVQHIFEIIKRAMDNGLPEWAHERQIMLLLHSCAPLELEKDILKVRPDPPSYTQEKIRTQEMMQGLVECIKAYVERGAELEKNLNGAKEF